MGDRATTTERFPLRVGANKVSVTGLTDTFIFGWDGEDAASLFYRRSIRLFYLSYNVSTAIEIIGFRWGPTPGTWTSELPPEYFLHNTLTVAGAVIAKEFGDHKYWEGGRGEALYLRSNGVADICWNAAYVIV